MTTHTPKAPVHAVVVSHNSERSLQWCLESLVQCDPPLQHIWVVDNASTDGTVPCVRKVATSVNKAADPLNNLVTRPPITLLRQSENLGFARANNIGMRHALEQGASHIFLLNHDATTHPQTPGLLATAQQNHSRFGVVSPIHYAGKQNTDESATPVVQCKPGDASTPASHSYDSKFWHNVIWHNQNQSLRDALSGPPQPDQICDNPGTPVEVPYVNAAAWMVSRTCLHAIGGFFPGFFMYGEDDEFLQRARHYSFQVGICPEAAIWHDRRQEADPSVKKTANTLQDKHYALNMTRVILLDENRSPGQKKMQLARLYGQLIRRGMRQGDLRQWARVAQSCALAWRLRRTEARTVASNDLWRPHNQPGTTLHG